jgi:hypothetical protein
VSRLRALSLGLEALLRSQSDDLDALAAAAGLDPASDFRNADLSGLDLRGEDLRAFDFRDARFRGALIEGARFNHTVSAGQKEGAIAFGDGRPPGPAARIAVIALGKRGIEVARHLRSPDWFPTSSASKGGARPYAVTHNPDVGAPGDVNSIYLAPSDVVPSLARFDIVVVIADDDVAESIWNGSSQIKYPGLTGPGIRLLVPALPKDRPSVILSGRGHGGGTFHAVIDTSIARSPHWTGNRWRALDRRIADTAIGAAMLVDQISTLNQSLSRLHDEGATMLMTFALGLPSGSKADPPQAGAMASEVVDFSEIVDKRDDVPPHFFAFEFESWLPKGPKGRGEGVGNLHKLGGANPSHFLASIGKAAAQQAGWRGLLETPDVPGPLRERLQYAAQVAGLSRAGGPPLAVIAETPDIELAAAADAIGWRVARYTDTEFLASALSESTSQAARRLPNELRLPLPNRWIRNVGLATRGVDPRDVIRLEGQLLDDVRREAPDLLARARLFRATFAVKAHQDPVHLLAINDLSEWLAATEDPTDQLRAYLRTARARKPTGPKRPADLQVAWSSPAKPDMRFVVADGPIPIRVDHLMDGEAPAQSMFIVDGDEAVPALLQSSVFAVWARATTTRSTSWMHRFSVGRTFEGFPVAAPFVMGRARNGGAYLRLDRTAERLHAEAVDWFRQSQVNVQRDSDQFSIELAAKARESLDVAILDAYELPPESTDLEIMKRLLGWLD